MRSIFNVTAVAVVAITALFYTLSADAQTYRTIDGWDDETNRRIETFLNTTLPMSIRKVAVFDGDGTLFGQVPHYLADEALYRYADENYRGKSDPVALEKMAILGRMVADGDNVGKPYVEDRAHFLSGMTPRAVADMGWDCYTEVYRGKFYPEMKQLVENLREYGFEVWILTASPEFLYQRFMAEELGIPDVNVIGMKSVVENGVLTDRIVLPVPQDDGKASVIPTFIKTTPLVVGGNSRGDLDMLNLSRGLKIVVNPDDRTVRGAADGPMAGHTVKSYWERDPAAVIVRCNDTRDPAVRFHTSEWGIRENIAHPKTITK
jgi:phosphoserine phosphatase